jgi:dTDP-4-amino-4,6-dideoxygalactose transaminase
MGQRLGYRPGDLPVTEDVAERLLRLPYYYELDVDDQARVIAAVRSFFDKGAR